MSARRQARTDAQIADGLRLLADVIEKDGTPGRHIPEQALDISYSVSDPVGVVEFSERHGLTVTYPDDSGTAWAELPLGEGKDLPDRASSATYAGAVTLRVVYLAPADEEQAEVDQADAARRVL